MNLSMRTRMIKALIPVLLVQSGLTGGLQSAYATDLADIPMAVNNLVKANSLVVYDNSQSMDAFMAGTLVAGDNAATRGNIGRQIMRDAITNYRTSFNWGLMTYRMTTNPPTKYNTYAYYLGSNTTMHFTSTCISGRTPAPESLRCIANPQPFTGGEYVTYEKSGDDSDVLDVLYTSVTTPSMWGLTAGSGTGYKIY